MKLTKGQPVRLTAGIPVTSRPPSAGIQGSLRSEAGPVGAGRASVALPDRAPAELLGEKVRETGRRELHLAGQGPDGVRRARVGGHERLGTTGPRVDAGRTRLLTAVAGRTISPSGHRAGSWAAAPCATAASARPPPPAGSGGAPSPVQRASASMRPKARSTRSPLRPGPTAYSPSPREYGRSRPAQDVPARQCTHQNAHRCVPGRTG